MMSPSEARAGVPRRAVEPRPRTPATPSRRRTDRRPDLRVVDRSAGARRRLAGLVVVLATMALFGSLFGLAVFHTLLVQSQAELDELDQEISRAEAHTEELRLEVAELESPERIMRVAVEELGLVRPPEVVMLTPPDASAPAPEAPGEPPGTSEPVG